MKYLVLIGLLIILIRRVEIKAQSGVPNDKSGKLLRAASNNESRLLRLKESVDALRQLTRSEPGNAKARYSLGVELIALGLYGEACESLYKG
jgi:hypothetical protein